MHHFSIKNFTLHSIGIGLSKIVGKSVAKSVDKTVGSLFFDNFFDAYIVDLISMVFPMQIPRIVAFPYMSITIEKDVGTEVICSGV